MSYIHLPPRSTKWPTLERNYIQAYPQCFVCGNAQCRRNVHHLLPFSYMCAIGRLDLELDPRNLVTLCSERPGNHHVDIGHLGWNSSFNPWFLDTANRCKGLMSKDIRRLSWYRELRAMRPKPAHRLNSADLNALRIITEKTFPRFHPA